MVTRPDAPAGRGRSLVRSPVGAWADERGIEVLTPAKPREPEFLERLRELAPDCVPVVAYGALVPPAALEIPRHGWVNLHFSLLPAWRGAAPVQHAVLHGDEITGACVFQLEAGLDTGPVYGTLTEEIRPTDTAGDLLDRLAASGAGLLVAVLDAIAGGHRAGRCRSRPRGCSSRRRSPSTTRGCAGTSRRSRSTAGSGPARRRPAPGRRSAASGSSWARCGRSPTARALPPGELLVEPHRVLVGTATTPVALGEVRAAGKRAMPAADWARGVRVESSERFE